MVIREALWGFPPGANGVFCVRVIEDENIFLQQLVLAEIGHEQTVELVAGILLAVAGRQTEVTWFAATLNEKQLEELDLQVVPDKLQDGDFTSRLPEADELRRLFVDSPIGICIMEGPEHHVTFINKMYVRMTGRKSAHEAEGKAIRELYGELAGQPFFGLLDRVYRTGEPFTGIEMKANLVNEKTGILQEHYFDFVYYPVRDRKGEVCGIMSQATDVTDRVLDKQVRESREQQLYRQWAELDALYRDSPLGMCLIDAKKLTIVRLNETKARMLGHPLQELIGKNIVDLMPHLTYLEGAYRQVVREKTTQNFELEVEGLGLQGMPGHRLWNLTPVFDARGDVESISSIVLDIAKEPTPLRSPSVWSLVNSG
jgi:PAS domain S-box-containing protein